MGEEADRTGDFTGLRGRRATITWSDGRRETVLVEPRVAVFLAALLATRSG